MRNTHQKPSASKTGFAQKAFNSTYVSGWMVKVLPTYRTSFCSIPPTEVGGSFIPASGLGRKLTIHQLPLVVFRRSFSMTIVGWNERSTQLPLVVFCASLLKCEHELRPPANSGRREVAERHEEAWILSASPQRGLDVDQILESNLPRQTIFK